MSRSNKAHHGLTHQDFWSDISSEGTGLRICSSRSLRLPQFPASLCSPASAKPFQLLALFLKSDYRDGSYSSCTPRPDTSHALLRNKKLSRPLPLWAQIFEHRPRPHLAPRLARPLPTSLKSSTLTTPSLSTTRSLTLPSTRSVSSSKSPQVVIRWRLIRSSRLQTSRTTSSWRAALASSVTRSRPTESLSVLPSSAALLSPSAPSST